MFQRFNKGLPLTRRTWKLVTAKSMSNFGFIKSMLPAKFEPYYRLGRYDKQIGTLLLYLPCTWGVALGVDPVSLFEVGKYCGIFWVGAVAMRSAGCIINDLWDQDFDKHVERTKVRPLASGELTPKQAFYFLIPHLAVGLGVLTQLNWQAIYYSFAITPIAALYPVAKRYTGYPQAVLGLAFNWGIWVGFATMAGSVNLPVVLPLYLSGICWTLIYDTIYAHQDLEDDKKIGVKSTALTWGDKTKERLNQLNLMALGLNLLGGYMAGMNWMYYPGVLSSNAFLSHIIRSFDMNDRKSCDTFFKYNKWYGVMIFLSILLGKNWI